MLFKRIGYVFVALIAILLIKGERHGNATLFPNKGDQDGITVYVLDHFWHASLIIPVDSQLARQNPQINSLVHTVGNARWLEVGWGDKGFYQAGTTDQISISMVVNAMLRPSKSVVHVVSFNGYPAKVFPRSKLVRITLSQEGFKKLLEGISRSVKFGKLGSNSRGLYGNGRFFAASGSYHVFSICNHWVARLLAQSGVPINVSLASRPGLMRFDLVWRGNGKAVKQDVV